MFCLNNIDAFLAFPRIKVAVLPGHTDSEDTTVYHCVSLGIVFFSLPHRGNITEIVFEDYSHLRKNKW